MKHLFRRYILGALLLIACSSQAISAEWSFSGGYIYFDNSLTRWHDNSIMLIIGKSNWSGVYEMIPVDETTTDIPDRYVCALPTSGWGDAEYMAVIGGGSVWNKGAWGESNLKNATHYTGAYKNGLRASAGQGYLLSPQTAANGCTLSLSYLGENFKGVTFDTQDKNNCYKIDTDKGLITFIFSTSAKRFNIDKSDISKVYVYGSVTAWDNQKEAFRLTGYSDDGCLYRSFPLSAMENVGNSGQPEFLFHVYKQDGSDYVVRSHSSWEGGIDYRLVFINNGENMVVAMPGDDINEIYARCKKAQVIATLSDYDFSRREDQERISNFRQVPTTKQLYRSYHPFSPSRPQYSTEERRLYYVAQLATEANIQCDIALSGDMTKDAGRTYTCNNKTYTITIPAYYQSIINNDNVLYVGTVNGVTPTYSDALFYSGEERFAQWIKEVVEFIIDDSHPAPFQIHCALGSDRTGAFCATLAAMCGATWEQIAVDYETTSNMQVEEYRHRNCIRYCLKRLCGVDPSQDPTFGKAVIKHFIDNGFLTEDQINKLITKLTSENISSSVSAISNTVAQPQKQLSVTNGVPMLLIEKGGLQYDVTGRVINTNNIVNQ